MVGWLRKVFGRAKGEPPHGVSIAVEATPRRTGPPPRKPGVIYRSDYLSSERETQLLTLDADGLPTGALERRADRLVIVPDGHPQEMVNPRSTSLYRLGIFSFRVRGTSYHESAARSGDFGPGRSVRLVREPDNQHDPNAIAVYAESGRKPIGYVNKQNAKRLAKLLDAGAEFAAISTRGGGPGREEISPVTLAARRDVLAHLTRRL
jgi:HIRAN domain-containing protein